MCVCAQPHTETEQTIASEYTSKEAGMHYWAAQRFHKSLATVICASAKVSHATPSSHFPSSMPVSSLSHAGTSSGTVTSEPGAETLVSTMASNGALTVLVTGGFENFSGPVAKMVGFDQHHANRFEIANGRLTGQVREPILGPDAKLETLLALSSKNCVAITETLAIGDGANDVPMIQAAGLGIAYHGKSIAREAALKVSNTGQSGACIDHADLTAALFFQGYRRREFTKYSL